MNKINIEERYKYTLEASIISGIAAHGFMFTNKFSFHDDIGQLFGIGGTVSFGRWTLAIIMKIMGNTIGKYSMPLFAGILSMMFIAVSACIFVNLLGIERRISCILIGCIMEVFPVVTATYVFMFTAPSYFLSLLLMAMSLYLVGKKRFWSVGGGGYIYFGHGNLSGICWCLGNWMYMHFDKGSNI